MMRRSPSAALAGVGCAVVGTKHPAVVRALIENPPSVILDTSGTLPTGVEALPGYKGLAW